jgi:[protein-PII] uridylyltransferase
VTDSLGSGDIGEEKLTRLKGHLEQVIDGKLDVENILTSPFEWTSFNKIPEGMVEEKIQFSNILSSEYTVLEIRLPDSIGLLYKILKALISFDVEVHYVKVATSADFAYDSFYLKTKEGKKITDENVYSEIRRKIQESVKQSITEPNIIKV